MSCSPSTCSRSTRPWTRNGVWAQVASVAASGNDVTVTFKAPNVPFAANRRQDADRARAPVVVGGRPGEVHQHQAGRHRPVHARQVRADAVLAEEEPELLAGGQDRAAEVVFPAQASNQSTNQLDVTSGKFDWSYNFLPERPEDLRLPRFQAQRVLVPAGRRRSRLFLNLTKAPYSDVNFRKGISLSLDRTTIATKAVNGYMAAGQPVRNDPAEPEEVARPEPAGRGRRQAGPRPRRRRLSRRPASRPRAASSSARTASRPR